MKIIVDAMGGDHAPKAIIEGVVEALRECDVHITLIGLSDRIEAELRLHSYPKDRIDIVHAPEVVGMEEPATVSLRKKKKSSISLGIDLLKKGGHHAFLSAGNTGAVVAASTINLGMIKGVDRPGIGLILPTLRDYCFMMDVGANTEPKAEHLLQFALMAKVYSREILGVDDPTVGLLNIGQEAEKGTGFEKETHKLMQDKVDNFIGNVEASELYHGTSDCVICDGYVGNIVLKVSEGLLESTGKLMKREVKKHPLALLGAWLMKRSLRHIRKLADYAETGGAPLLGVNGVVIISHGRSGAKAIKNTIRAAMREVDHDILTAMAKAIAEKTNQEPDSST